MHSYCMQFEGDSRFGPEISFEALSHDFSAVCTILGDPGAVSRVDKMFTVRSTGVPGHLLLPNQFQKRLNCPLLIGQKNFFLANQRRVAAG